MGAGGGGRGRGPPPGGNGGGPGSGLGMDGDNYYQNPNNHHTHSNNHSHRFGFSAGSGPGSGPGSSSGSVHDGVSMSASGGGMGNSNSNVNANANANANAKDDMSVEKSFMGSGPGNNEKRSLPTFESMSQSIDDGNSMGLGGSINMNNSNNNNNNNNSNNKSNKRMRSYESLGSPGNNMNMGMGMGPADDIGMGPSMPPTNIHMNSGPGGRGSPRRDFMHSGPGPGPGGNSFGRGRGRGRGGGGGGRGGLHHSSYPPDRDRDRDRDLPHRDRNMSMNNDMHGGMGPGPNPGTGPGAIMGSMGGGNDFDEDQFGRKIPQSNAGGMGRGAPYGRGGGHRERSFSSMGRGRGGYGRLGGAEGRGSGSGGRYSSMAHSDRFVSGRSGMGMGRGFSHNRPSPAEHYSPRASTGPTSSGGMSPDFHSRHSSGLGSNDINKDSQTQIQIQTQQHKSHPQDTSINSKSTRQALATSKTVSTSTPSKRDSTPPPQREDEKVDIVPPSPPASQPSGLAQALARLSDANAEMEFQYAKHLQLTKEHEIIKAKIERLKELPVGVDAFKDDLDALMKKDENKYFANA